MHRKLLLSTLIAGCLAVPAQSALAQSGDDESGLEEIVVTARKREESLQEIPIAITSVSSLDILEGGLTGLEDLSQLASGFYFFNQGQNQPGRYNTQLRFRGLNQAQFSPSFETGALFIDGVYVLNGGTSLSLMDIERVEVIKGPQSAYFGRNTFGGAVNFITRDPSMEEFGGEVNVSGTHRSRFDVTAFVEGPLIPDVLSGSLSARVYDKQGHFTASDGGRLGDENTETISAKLLWQPSDNLSVRFRASYSEDDDGAPAQAYVAGRVNDSCSGRTITTPAGETVNPVNFICGQVPDVDSTIPVTGSRVIDGNTTLPPGLNGAGLSLAEVFGSAPLPPGVPGINDIGLIRETLRLSAHATYSFDNGMDLDVVLGVNDQQANFIRDFDLSAFPGGFSNDPQNLEDQSFEIRLTGPQDGRLRWSAGVNYYEQEFTSSLTGGTFMFGCIGLEPGNDQSDCVPGAGGNPFLLGPFPNGFGQSDEAEVLGIFASLDFDLTDTITLTAEGRYQQDTLTKGGVTGPDGLNNAPEFEFNEFLPRVIARWQPGQDTTLYASYALGVVPGDANDFFLNADEQERAQYLAQFPGLNESLPQEELDAFELGWKQVLFDGAGYLNVAVWWNEWVGIKGRSSGLINETCTANDVAIGAPGCTYDGVIGDVTTRQLPNPETGVLEPFFNARNILLDGDADLKGFEVDVGGTIVDGWTVDASVAYVDTEYTRYIFNFGEAIFGFSDVRGLSVPRVPKWSGNLTSTYRFDLPGAWEGFARTDINYFGETFTDERNLAFTEDYFITDVRIGAETDKYRVELFVNNLFDVDAWASGARFSDTAFPVDFGNFFVQQGVNVAPNDRQEFGLRASIMF
ncbi:MAG: TonB-dependent receptor [Pseudomonadota bacterium]